MNEFFGVCFFIVFLGLIVVEFFCDCKNGDSNGLCDILFFIDNIFCFI